MNDLMEVVSGIGERLGLPSTDRQVETFRRVMKLTLEREMTDSDVEAVSAFVYFLASAIGMSDPETEAEAADNIIGTTMKALATVSRMARSQS